MNRKSTFVPLQCLTYDHEPTQRHACGALHEIAQDPPGANMIEREGAAQILTEILRSPNPSISAFRAKPSPNRLSSLFITESYAASLLTKLAEDKPAEYRRQVDELVAVTLQGGKRVFMQ